jgi:hypothetical protein
LVQESHRSIMQVVVYPHNFDLFTEADRTDEAKGFDAG